MTIAQRELQIRGRGLLVEDASRAVAVEGGGIEPRSTLGGELGRIRSADELVRAAEPGHRRAGAEIPAPFTERAFASAGSAPERDVGGNQFAVAKAVFS